MMHTVGFLDDLLDKGIKIWLDEGQLAIRAPKAAITRQIQQEIKARKEEILSFLQAKNSRASEIELEPVPRDGGPLPLSFSQQRLWFIHTLEPDSANYNIPLSLEFEGELSMRTLEQCMTEIVLRHEVLRTVFLSHDGEASQHILPACTSSIPRLDLKGLSLDARRQEICRLERSHAACSFQLARGPLFRVTLLRLEEQRFVLLINFHHIIADGWSLGLLIQELALLYPAFLETKPSPLPQLPIQYADYAAWQQKRAATGAMAKQLEYWRGKLADAPTQIDLPTDHPRPAIQSTQGEAILLSLSPDLTAGLKTLAKNANASLFMTLLTAYSVVLSRYANQDEVVLGSPIANRNLHGTEPLIGFFVNMLALRVDCSGDPSFQDLLERVRQTTLEAYAHQDISFGQVVEALRLERDMSRHPLFQAGLILQNNPSGNLNLPGLAVHTRSVETTRINWDVNLVLEEKENQLSGALEYCKALFDPKSMERFHTRFLRVLQSAVTEPEKPLSQTSMMDADERTMLIDEWNRTQKPYPDETIHASFEAKARKDPEDRALVVEDTHLTYRALDSLANRLAHHLVSRGIGPENRVGIFLNRSAALVCGLLGVHKAGGAYVPLDINTPPKRLAFMIEDAGVQIMLTHADLLEKLPSATVPNILLNADGTVVGIEEQETTHKTAPSVPMHPENLAYIIFTSGSTGTPKGVQVSHRTVSHFFTIMDGILHPGNKKNEVWLAVTNITFDISVLELLWTLTRGVQLVIRSVDGLAFVDEDQGGIKLSRLLQSHRITHLQCTPSMAQLILGRDQFRAGLGHLDYWLLGGEMMTPSLVRQIRAVTPAKILNMYGPTETTVWCSHHQVSEPERMIPIGKPAANTTFYITDKHLDLQPVGIRGELLVGGEGVTRGYLRRPELTAERFIPDPFSGKAGARVYRTGDLTRYRHDGDLLFEGRIDFQVKLRGFRVELGEIEAVIEQHPDVEKAAVLNREDKPGQQILAAYIRTEKTETSKLTGELTEQLSGKLPEYMIPSAFILMTQFPLTPSGKLDRRALPEPDIESTEPENTLPRTDVENQILARWRQVLKRASIGIHDNFFALGGHSLLATQVISRARDTFSVELSPRHLFLNPTPAALGKAIQEVRSQGLATQPITGIDRDQIIPLSFAQQRLWFIYQLDPKDVSYNISTNLQMRGTLDREALDHAATQLVKRHEVLRTIFREHNGEPVQDILEPERVNIPLIDLTGLDESGRAEEKAYLESLEGSKPFILEKGPLFRLTLIRFASDEYFLWVCMHHIIADGWSMAILVRELQEFYQAHSSGEATASSLPELPIQYADFAVWQRNGFEAGLLELQLAYWREKLDDAPPFLDLPTDKPRPPVQRSLGGSVPILIPADTVRTLQDLEQRTGTTTFMTLLAGFASVLGRYSNQKDIVVGVPIANRNHSATEHLIGFFVNMLAARIDLGGEPTVEALLERVRRTMLEAYENQDIPFESLVDALQISRDMSRAPLFQTALTLQNMPRRTLTLPGLELEMVPSTTVTVKWDLHMELEEFGEEILGALTYNLDLFQEETITRMVRHFIHILEAFTQSLETPLSRVSLVTAEEEQTLRRWNQNTMDASRFPLIHHAFEQCAEANPQNIAVVFEQTALTYRQLQACTNHLAHELVSRGVGPEVPVGIFMQRSLEVPLSMLAILKAGGVFVTIDPDQPRERLRGMLANLTLVLTSKTLSPVLEDLSVPSMVIDEATLSKTGDVGIPKVQVTPSNAAYMIFTSGSTGMPKLTANTHGGVRNQFCWRQLAFKASQEDRGLIKVPYTFDVTVIESFYPLLSGGRVVVTRPEGHKEPHYLSELIHEHQITIIHFVPTTLEAFLDEARLDHCRSLKWIFCGGEPLLSTLASRCERALPDATLINIYGPAEAVVDVTWQPTEEYKGPLTVMPIGQPLPNSQLWITDHQLRSTPPGIPGELVLGGVQVARGYHGQPGLTAERFVPDPFGNQPGGRVYRTGDYTRFLPGYEEDRPRVAFLGRIDFQVKLRGVRLEPGEIETVLLQYPGIRKAVVLLSSGPNQQPLLTAYLATIEAAETPSTQQLTAFLRQQLPSNMIPSAFVFLDTFPLTTSGKVNRKALPAPEAAADRPEYTPPRTELETKLTEIWSDIIGVHPIGVFDNFFQLGGHSLLATRVISKVQEQFQTRVPLAQLMEEPTVAGLAELIEHFQWITDGEQQSEAHEDLEDIVL